jgi:hypothetical protein
MNCIFISFHFVDNLIRQFIKLIMITPVVDDNIAQCTKKLLFQAKYDKVGDASSLRKKEKKLIPNDAAKSRTGYTVQGWAYNEYYEFSLVVEQ